MKIAEHIQRKVHRFLSKYIYTCYDTRNNYSMRITNHNKIELFFESNTFALSTHN